MRKILVIAAVLALAGCGGGGGGGSTTPTNPISPGGPGTTPSSKYVTPTFIIKIPPKGSKAKFRGAKARNPKYVASLVQSVVITLTATSNPVGTSLSGNPATTPVNGAGGTVAGNCASGCTVNGPPSPPGTDSYTIVTYDGYSAPNASGSALNAGQLNNVTITAGQSNPETVTLGAIPITLSINNVPQGVFTAGTTGNSTAVSIATADADGTTIPTAQNPSVKYVDATGAPLVITLSDPDTNPHGTCLVVSGTSPCTTGAATSVTFTSPDDTRAIAYDGLAENPVTLTASAPTATSATDTTYPKLNAPAFNSAAPGDLPAGVALTSSAEIDLFTLSGTGSTGTEYFTEAGWTDSPYNQALTQAAGTCLTGTGYVATSLAGIATMSVGANDTTNGTPITATVAASPTGAGSCADTISDGLSLNSTDGSATLTVTYTTSSIGASAKHRRH